MICPTISQGEYGDFESKCVGLFVFSDPHVLTFFDFFWLFLFATHIDEEVDGAAGKQGESVESEMRGEEEQ